MKAEEQQPVTGQKDGATTFASSATGIIETDVPEKKVERTDQQRLSQAFSRNLAEKKVESYRQEKTGESDFRAFADLSKEDAESINNSEKAFKESHPGFVIERGGKSIALSSIDTQIVKVIFSQIDFYSQKVNDTIKRVTLCLSYGSINFGDEYSPIRTHLSIAQLSKEILGSTRERHIRLISDRLQYLSQVKQVLNVYNKDKGFKIVSPILILTEQQYDLYSNISTGTRGRKKQNPGEEKELLISANVEIPAPLLYGATNKYCPFYKERYLRLCKKHKRNDVAQTLLSDLEAKWYNHYVGFRKIDGTFKSQNEELFITDKEKYQKELEKAKYETLIYKCSIDSLKDRVTMYSDDSKYEKQYRAKFKKSIKDAIEFCKEYGIITGKSGLSKDGENAILVYNPSFVKMKDDGQVEDAKAEEIPLIPLA